MDFHAQIISPVTGSVTQAELVNRSVQCLPDISKSEDDYDLSGAENSTAAPGHLGHATTRIDSTESHIADICNRTSSEFAGNNTLHRRDLAVEIMSGLTPPNRHVATEVLPDDILLDIFGFYQRSSPLQWHRLVHVCRKWRSVVFASARRLDLRLYCRQGTPVSKTLYCWPTLPIVVEYGGSPTLIPPAPEDEDNIVAALKRSDRVNSISLTVTSSLLIKLNKIKRGFSKLEDLVLLSGNTRGVELPRAFTWSSRLRSLHSTGVNFPALPRLLSSSRNLVDIQLHNVPNIESLSPEGFAGTLSGMTQLRSLSLHLRSHASHASHPRRAGIAPLSSSGERVVLPALTRLIFRGTSEFLGRFVTRVDCPLLGDIEITFNQPTSTISVPKLAAFIGRIEVQKSHRRADILSSERAISICFTEPGAPTRFKFEVSCESLNLHSFMPRMYDCFSAFFDSVEDVRVNATRSSSRQGDRDGEEWLEFIHRFRGAKWFHVAGNYSTNVVCALESDRRLETALPVLQNLCIQEPEPHYAPMREAVASFMNSCRLSGRLIGVEYGRMCISETGPLAWQMTTLIEMLPDDVLLNVFRHYLYASPQNWPTLAHISKRWRQIVLTSPQSLNLRLYCTYGRPVLKSLDCWPALPIVVQYGGSPTLDPPAPEDEVNIAAALAYSDRVSSISLTLTSSLLEKMSTIKEPFSELEELILLSENTGGLVLPSGFRWGARMRSLRWTRIASPALPRLLSPCQNLVDLQLHRIPSAGYFPPDVFANALSGMTQLQSLLLHFFSSSPGSSRRNRIGAPSLLGERVVLPALTYLGYRGVSTYLDSFVARIDAPCLGDLEITFFHQLTFDVSHLGRFVDRMGVHKSHYQADVLISRHAIAIIFTQRGSPAQRIRLQVSCEQLDWQLSSLARICHNLSDSTSGVGDLCIETTQSSSASGYDVDGEQWLQLIRLFSGTERLHLATELVTDILHALQPDGELAPGVLYSLTDIYIQAPEPHGESLRTAASSFAASRQRSGRPVKVKMENTQSAKTKASLNQLEVKKYVNKKVFVHMQGGRKISGTLRAYDLFLNLVIDGAQDETAPAHRRPIGAIIIRGNNITLMETPEAITY